MNKKTPKLYFVFCYLVLAFTPPAYSQSKEDQLVSAIKEENHFKVDSLLKVGANPNFQQSNTSPSLCMLAVYHSDLSMLKSLLKYGANSKQKGILNVKRTFEEYNFGSILHIAAAEGKTSIVNYAIDSLGISIDLLDNSVNQKYPVTPLYLACKTGKNRTIIELLNKKANTKLDFESPLFALLKNQTINENLKDQILAEIFSSFDYEKLIDNEGKTVFHYLDFQFLFIEKLINTGTQFSEVQDYSGNTALHYIVQKENYLLAQKLINDGFDVNIKNNVNKTALDFIDNLKIKSRLGNIEEDTLKYDCWKYLTKRALFEVYNKKEENYLSLLKIAKEKIDFNNIDDSYLYYSTVDQINILMDDHENIPISNSKVDSLFILNPNLSLFNRIQYYKNKSICEYFCLNRLDQADSLLNISKNKLFLLNGSFSEEMAEILDLESSYKVGYVRFNEAQKLLQDVEIILNELQSELYFLLSPSAFNQAQVLVFNENYELKFRSKITLHFC